MKKLCAFLLVLSMAAPAWADGSNATIVLGNRHCHGTPNRTGCARTGGGNITVSQPSPDVVVITMSGAVAASGHPFRSSAAAMDFCLHQDFKVLFADPKKVYDGKLFMECQVVGLLRTGCHCDGNSDSCAGSAEQGQACASVTCGPQPVTSLCIAPHAVGCKEKMSINCQKGPNCVPVQPGCYHLHGTFQIGASHTRSLLPCRPASAEFAADALPSAWRGHHDAFRGADKSGFGFRITLRVAATEVDVKELAAPKNGAADGKDGDNGNGTDGNAAAKDVTVIPGNGITEVPNINGAINGTVVPDINGTVVPVPNGAPVPNGEFTAPIINGGGN